MQHKQFSPFCRSKATSGSTHSTVLFCVITVPVHLLSLSSYSPLNTCRNNQVRPVKARAAVKCLGCGVMMYTSANVVQFTLGAESKHVHVTLWKFHRWGLWAWWQETGGKYGRWGLHKTCHLSKVFNLSRPFKSASWIGQLGQTDEIWSTRELLIRFLNVYCLETKYNLNLRSVLHLWNIT